ncbi:terminal uridylyltransferase 4 [Protopterus annectens]|uniref:terminal uridylyltransferase 4 n=1 Tax=Protopterus annectens TaxID=7888 RepID=UPI001CFA38F6|nr:terminal uridylyltransferase 4 [Protopterus annectens]
MRGKHMCDRSQEYPNCQYLCKLCSVHIENVQGAHKHIKEKRHKKNILEKQEENELRGLPGPSATHLAALSVAVNETAKQQGISEEDFQVRQEIVNQMEKIIQLKLPECTLRIYGSSLTRFGFNTSDINIDVCFPSTLSQPDVLIQVLETLKNCSLYADVFCDRLGKLPIVCCRCLESGLTCKVSAGNDVAWRTTTLLTALGRLEPTLRPLVLAFRYWAKLCHTDCQAEGGIPSYSFVLMVIFFLQQRTPKILPAYLGSWIEGFDLKRVDDYYLKGIEDDTYLLWEYHPSNCREGKKSNGNEGRSRGNHRKIGTKEAECSESDNYNTSSKEKQGRSSLIFETSHEVSLGQLWLELLRFYTLEFAMEEHVISIRVTDHVTREIKGWPKRRIAVEDPFALKRNIARSLNSQMVFEYILERFRTAYKYFACPQTKNGIKSKYEMKNDKGNLNSKKMLKANVNIADCCPAEEEKQVDSLAVDSQSVTDAIDLAECSQTKCSPTGKNSKCFCHSASITKNKVCDACWYCEVPADSIMPSACLQDYESCFIDQELQSVNHVDRKLSDAAKHSQLTVNKSEHAGNVTTNVELFAAELSQVDVCKSDQISVTCSEEERCASIHKASTSRNHTVLLQPPCGEEVEIANEELYYVFDKFILTSGKPPTIVCSICKRDGHSNTHCPEDFKKVDLKPLPPMTKRFKEILDHLCKLCYDELAPTFFEQQGREQIVTSLERFIRKEFSEKARLCLFGSSKNGFGFHDSDLDICMTLEGHETAEKLNCKEIIEGLAKILRRHPGLRNILPITTAKVPIVKFEHRQSGLEGDISLYNTLAQHNTRMLAMYAAIDPRVKYLGYTMKVFAKRCDIGDASRGSLSSYAYILMVLYFLQQRKPPVIPVLQEIFDGEEVPLRIIDGWNAFFCDSVMEVKKHLLEFGKNSESIGELWLGLLRFYTEEFNFKEHVISIRQKKLLTTFEKQWTSKCIAIEDPFDLNHNLGAGVSRKMTNFIMKAFINGRKLFGTPFYPLPGREAAYFFDSKVLTDGELAPNDRCCRICGKIGHYMKECPKRRRLKRKENGREEEKDLRDDEKEHREKRCFTCGDTGHVRRGCPEFKQNRSKNNSQVTQPSEDLQVIADSQTLPTNKEEQKQEESTHAQNSSECVRYTHPFLQISCNEPLPDDIKAKLMAATFDNKNLFGSAAELFTFLQEKDKALQELKCIFVSPVPIFLRNYPSRPAFLETQHSPSASPPGDSQQLILNSSSAPSSTNSPAQQVTAQPKHIQQQQMQPSQSLIQVHVPLINFPPLPHSHCPTLHNLRLFQPHLHHIALPTNSWPMHSTVNTSQGSPSPAGITLSFRPNSSSNTSPPQGGSPSLNDPSIIFAQPAVRPMGIPSTSQEGRWHNDIRPNSLVANGTMGTSDPHFLGPFAKLNPASMNWEATPRFPIFQTPWRPYNLNQSFIQQGSTGHQQSKPVFQGPVMQATPYGPILSQGHLHMNTNMNFIQQKK